MQHKIYIIIESNRYHRCSTYLWQSFQCNYLPMRWRWDRLLSQKADIKAGKKTLIYQSSKLNTILLILLHVNKCKQNRTTTIQLANMNKNYNTDSQRNTQFYPTAHKAQQTSKKEMSFRFNKAKTRQPKCPKTPQILIKRRERKMEDKKIYTLHYENN